MSKENKKHKLDPIELEKVTGGECDCIMNGSGSKTGFDNSNGCKCSMSGLGSLLAAGVTCECSMSGCGAEGGCTNPLFYDPSSGYLFCSCMPFGTGS